MKLLGKDVVESVCEQTRENAEDLRAKHIVPTLVIVKSQDSEDVNSYINQKVKKGTELGVNVKVVEYPANVLADKSLLTAEVLKLNADKNIHGILFQKPSHPNVNDTVEQLVDPAKDVDGFLPDSPHKPPVYLAVMRFLKRIYQKEYPEVLQSKSFVIIGKGKTGGGPIIDGLKKDGINSVHVIDSKTAPEDRTKYLKFASVIVSAVGVHNPVDPALIPEQSIVIDFGVHFEDGKIQPDFLEHDIQERAAYYTTTPGGVGVLTVAYLMDNVVNAARVLS
jgi:methylenetetrahydrofolate dehydrogenase (NADP+)/methenyltetrahydrofolate cyclohydrolase